MGTKHENIPILDKLLSECQNTRPNAHSVAVSLPSDANMGNSDVR